MPDIFVAPATKEGEKEEKLISEVSQPEIENIQDQPPAKTGLASGPSSPLAALMVNPPGVYFQNQEREEAVILLLRRHWITNLPWILVGALMLVMPLLASLLFLTLNFPLQFFTPYIFVGGAFWYLISSGYLFINFLIWYFNADVVTNERIIDISFHNLIYKEVSTTRLEKLQDVTLKMGGTLRQIFNYGDVFVQTAGTEPNFNFLAIPKPAWVARKLGELMERASGGKR